MSLKTTEIPNLEITRNPPHLWETIEITERVDLCDPIRRHQSIRTEAHQI